MDEIPAKTGINQEIRNEKGQFVPGVSGHPEGKPKGLRSFTTKVREALETIAEGKDYTYEAAFIKAILKKSIVDQDVSMMRTVWEQLDGKPLQRFANPDGSNLFDNMPHEQSKRILERRRTTSDNSVREERPSGLLDSDKPKI